MVFRLHNSLAPALLLLFFLSIQTAKSQENNLKLHGISAGFGWAATGNTADRSGIGANFDLSTILKKNIFSFNFNSGFDISTDLFNEQFYELNLTYGRKFNILTKLVLEGHVGVGLFAYDIDLPESFGGLDAPELAVGFPIRLKLLYHLSDRFALGANPNLNFNSLNDTLTAHFILQYYIN